MKDKREFDDFLDDTVGFLCCVFGSFWLIWLAYILFERWWV
jgi:hypothetical protein